MSVLEVKPLVLKDVVAIIGTDDFRKHLSKVELTPSSSSSNWTGLGGNTHTDQSTATWAANLTYVQDWDSPESLSGYLFDNEGEMVEMEFRPRSGTGPSFTCQVVIVPGAIGGAVNAYSETSVALGVNGKPLRVAAPVEGAALAKASTATV